MGRNARVLGTHRMRRTHKRRHRRVGPYIARATALPMWAWWHCGKRVSARIGSWTLLRRAPLFWTGPSGNRVGSIRLYVEHARRLSVLAAPHRESEHERIRRTGQWDVGPDRGRVCRAARCATLFGIDRISMDPHRQAVSSHRACCLTVSYQSVSNTCCTRICAHQ